MVAEKRLLCDYMFASDAPDVRVCLDTQRRIDSSSLVDFVASIICETKKESHDDQTSDTDECELITFKQVESAEFDEGETTKRQKRYHAHFLRRKSDVEYRLSQDCVVRTTKVSETSFGTGERNTKWETEIEFIATQLPPQIDDNDLESRLEDFFKQVYPLKLITFMSHLCF